jgi:hypothetical protein
MTDNTDHIRPQMVQHAERNASGELIYTSEVEVAPGMTKTVERNVRRLFTPGDRKTGNHDILQAEAKLAADGVDLGNPAKPVNGDVAEQHLEWCDREGIEPAWEVCDREEWTPP